MRYRDTALFPLLKSSDFLPSSFLPPSPGKFTDHSYPLPPLSRGRVKTPRGTAGLYGGFTRNHAYSPHLTRFLGFPRPGAGRAKTRRPSLRARGPLPAPLLPSLGGGGAEGRPPGRPRGRLTLSGGPEPPPRSPLRGCPGAGQAGGLRARRW